MKLAIFGALLGTGLFIGGAVQHDTRFNGDHNAYHKRYDGKYGDSNRDKYILVAVGNKEEMAYWVGMTGAAILTVSLKHLWNQRKGKVAEQPYKRFRMLRDLAIGTGLVVGGYSLHDTNSHWDLPKVTRRLDGSWELLSFSSTPEEHWGFALGALGAVWLGASVKHSWDLRERNLDKAFLDFRNVKKTQGLVHPGLRYGSNTERAIRQSIGGSFVAGSLPGQGNCP